MGNTFAYMILHSRGECSIGSSPEEQIEKSKSHWSLLAESGAIEEGEEVAEMSNVRVFKALQQHPTWGAFFVEFNKGVKGWSTLEVRKIDTGSILDRHWIDTRSTLEVGKKFAEGAQAELYHAHVKWENPEWNEYDLECGTEWVLKVFKKGTFLSQLQHQLPQGLLKFRAESRERWKSPTRKRIPRFQCGVHRGTLLNDGRFAFLMVKEHFDLRNLIESKMKSRRPRDCGPFSKVEAEDLMYRVALGMDWLHSRDIVHRDLKASNVLVYEFKSGYPKWMCFVADYECSIGVVGTGFFRAPEILQALKEQKLSSKSEVFSRAADVYAYGMTCYEILIGKVPFEGFGNTDYDLVLNGQRPEVPEYVDDWIRELLSRCWQSNPTRRPTFEEILNLLSTNSAEVRKCEDSLKEQYGENFRSLHLTEITNS